MHVVSPQQGGNIQSRGSTLASQGGIEFHVSGDKDLGGITAQSHESLRIRIILCAHSTEGSEQGGKNRSESMIAKIGFL